MKFLGMLMIVGSLPAFMILLRMNTRYRHWAFFALGALPIVSSGINVDVAFYDLAMWPGHTKGIIVSLTDTLAISLIFHYFHIKSSRVFITVWLLYIASHIPGVFINGYSTASFTYIWSLLRGFNYFLACSVVIACGELRLLALGLSFSIIINGGDTIFNSASGQIQASGILGHRNYSGLVTNLAVPILLVSSILTKNVKIFGLALVFAAAGTALGGSRASVVLFGISFILTLVMASLFKPIKRTKVVTAVAIIGALIMGPIVVHKMNQRFAESGGGFSIEEDGERLAFRRASELMNFDYPLGVGLNQYAVKSNAEGYASKAGVAWTTIANTAIVHNSYVLVRTEGGHIALIGVFIMLGSLVSVSVFIVIQRIYTKSERLYASAILMSVIALSLHIRYEWSLVMIHVIYALAFFSAILGCILQQEELRRRLIAIKRFG